MSNESYWASPIRPADDFGQPIVDEFIDGRTVHGPWAIMTPLSHNLHGVRSGSLRLPALGTGYGQRYRRQPDGRFLKVEG